MYSSMAGIIPSLAIAGLVLILSWTVISHSTHYSAAGPLGASHAVGAGAVSFAAAFSVLNLALQWNVVSQALVGQEIGDGMLALRVISVTAAIAFERLMLVVMKEPKFVVQSNRISGDWKVDRNLLEEYKKQVGKWPVQAAVSQGTVLLVVLCLLWALQVLRRDSLSIALLNWSFAFVSGAFFMAASYRAERGVLPTRFHATLIWAFGTTTFALYCSVALQQFEVWQACLIIGPASFFLLWSGLDRLRNRVMLRILSALAGFGKAFEIEVGDLRDEEEALRSSDGEGNNPLASKGPESPGQ
jgi:hypothetical protein